MNEDQFNALEAWIMAAARAAAHPTEHNQEMEGDRREEAKRLLVEEEPEDEDSDVCSKCGAIKPSRRA